MKKFHILALTLLAAFSACSDDDNNFNNENNKNNDSQIKLIASKTEIEPFEDIKVSIDGNLNNLLNKYDSIKWITDGTAYYFDTNPWYSEDTDNDLRVTNYRKGKHKVYAFAYKNDTIESSDSIEYNVKSPTGDFINIKWNKRTKNEYLHFTIGQTPVKYYQNNDERKKYTGVSINLYHIVENIPGKEYVKFHLMPWSISSRSITIPDLTNFDWGKYIFEDINSHNLEGMMSEATLEYNFFHNYLTDLYGTPKFIYEGDDTTQSPLEKEYADRFDYDKEEYFYPVEIWDTPTSYIAILRCNNPIGIGYKKGPCYVIAQPRK